MLRVRGGIPGGDLRPGEGIETLSADCYTAEWRRTEPDFALYLPKGPCGPDGYNDHLHVIVSAPGRFLAIWTQGSQEAARDLRVVCAHSEDRGRSWTSPRLVVDDGGTFGLLACFGFPVVSASGRIYCLYNKHLGATDGGHYFTSVLRCATSDDGGDNWTHHTGDMPFRRTRFDHPDPRVPCKCIVWQKPIRDAQGRWVVGMSRFSSVQVFPKPERGFHLDSSSEFMRFENVDDDPDPRDLVITWLPEHGDPVRVPCPIEPERSKGYSLGEEPGVVLLPDGRLFATMRTVTGRIWYSVSDDDGRSWKPAKVLLRHDRGEEMLHPKSPCPLYATSDGRYLLFFHNHDGTGYGARGPWDMNARRPVFVAVGRFAPGAEQPLAFAQPKLLFDTHGVGVGPESLIWLAMYSSFTEFGGERILWYPDRKHFLVGRVLTDQLLDSRPPA